MTKEEIESKIDEALENVEMPIETRELLILLRAEIPKAKSKQDYINIGLKWFELIVKVGGVVASLNQE